MKNSVICLIFSIFTFFNLSGQVDWNTQGNTVNGTEWFGAGTGSDIPVSFEHRADDDASSFIWSTTTSTTLLPRMILTRPGWLGLNTTAPASIFHVRSDASQASGLVSSGLQITHDLIGNNYADGLLIGPVADISAILECRMNWQEDSPLSLMQNNLLRIRMTQDDWGGTTGLNRVLIPYTATTGGVGPGIPFSMLHLGTSPAFMQRDWMNVGTTFGSSVNGDLMHVGLLEHDDGLTDAVVAWGCQWQGITGGPDNLRFLFLTSTAAGVPASAQEGLETARITPEGLMGIGDFSNGSGQGVGTADYIDATLDIDGDLRIRTVTENDELTRVLVIDDNDHNRVHWIDIGDISGQCDWNVNGQDVIMGYPGSTPVPACRSGNVAIGTHIPAARLDVRSANTIDRGVNVRSSSDDHNFLYAIDSRASFAKTNQDIYAVRANASNNTSCGVPFSTTQAYGVHAYANSGNKNFAVYAQAIPHISPSGWASDTCAAYISSWAGYFNGATFSPGGVWTASDEQLKTSINYDSDASSILSQLSPATYEFNHNATPGLYLPAGNHWGLMAQQLEEVLPVAVSNMVHPAQYDDGGNQTSPEYEFKAVNYTELIPILIAGHKEQQSKIDDLAEQVAFLTELVAACCESGGAKSLNQPQGPKDERMNYDLRIEQPYLGQNVPNPFMVETSITYRIPEQAMVRVRVMDAKGQQADMLVDGLMPKGEYRIVWNASHLPAGLYFYTLEADGVELVKKAVKL